MRQTVRAAAALAVVALLAAACGSSGSSGSSSSPSSSSSSSSKSSGTSTSAKFTGCMVTDTGGIDDKSFNASSWQGMQQAQAADPSKVTVKYLQSTSSADYASNISAFLGQKCGIIVTVGFLMAGATGSAAGSNPSSKFAIVDCALGSASCPSSSSGKPTTPPKNVDSLVFDTVQDGFLGGYLAAGMTKTGKVATFGGEKLPTVTIYMDGFWDGVQYYNQQHHKHVQVLGWNEQTQSGEFTNSFTNLTMGQTITQQFITEGADIIFPVAGGVGLGAMKAVQDADNAAGTQKVNAMWVDTDGCVSAAQYCKYFITSVEKGIQTAVKTSVLDAANGTFKGGTYIGTLANGGVTLAPYHDFATKVPASLQAEINTLKGEIISGKIKPATKSPV
ncbi:MAG TPA: BMP family ABC transporter substrate-binding protein [Streptosporangiaceae bacterium]|nr:BMP family ABC transporter substrate-binding protein [Streptosporangiaceae bacterium]